MNAVVIKKRVSARVWLIVSV